MRTTLVIPDAVYRALKARAAESGQTISRLATEFIRRGLEAPERTRELRPLPTFDVGRLLLDPSDRVSLERAIDAERDGRLYGGTGPQLTRDGAQGPKRGTGPG